MSTHEKRSYTPTNVKTIDTRTGEITRISKKIVHGVVLEEVRTTENKKYGTVQQVIVKPVDSTLNASLYFKPDLLTSKEVEYFERQGKMEASINYYPDVDGPAFHHCEATYNEHGRMISVEVSMYPPGDFQIGNVEARVYPLQDDASKFNLLIINQNDELIEDKGIHLRDKKILTGFGANLTIGSIVDGNFSVRIGVRGRPPFLGEYTFPEVVDMEKLKSLLLSHKPHYDFYDGPQDKDAMIP